MHNETYSLLSCKYSIVNKLSILILLTIVTSNKLN